MSKENSVKFTIGQIIHHKMFDYRGVVVDVDPVFNSTEEWYEKVAKSKPPKDKPWYHVLVDGQLMTTYVAERHLDVDASSEPITHPLTEDFFDSFENGVYQNYRANN